MEHNKEYFRAHAWLIYWYGRAERCENKKCTYENPKRYEWALIKGEKYEKKRDNYMQLCPSCHRKYDFTEEQREKMSNARKGKSPKNKRAVVLDGSKEFPSITQAANEMGISITSISNNLSGLSMSTKAGKWSYKQKI
jgi:CRISPR/Cas system-associated protein Cas10 (large subunit of type III CRISPR-Cas system)